VTLSSNDIEAIKTFPSRRREGNVFSGWKLVNA